LVMRAGGALRVAHLIKYGAAHRNSAFSNQGVIAISMDRAARALDRCHCLCPFVQADALKRDVMHHIKVFSSLVLV